MYCDQKCNFQTILMELSQELARAGNWRLRGLIRQMVECYPKILDGQDLNSLKPNQIKTKIPFKKAENGAIGSRVTAENALSLSLSEKFISFDQVTFENWRVF